MGAVDIVKGEACESVRGVLQCCGGGGGTLSIEASAKRQGDGVYGKIRMYSRAGKKCRPPCHRRCAQARRVYIRDRDDVGLAI